VSASDQRLAFITGFTGSYGKFTFCRIQTATNYTKDGFIFSQQSCDIVLVFAFLHDHSVHVSTDISPKSSFQVYKESKSLHDGNLFILCDVLGFLFLTGTAVVISSKAALWTDSRYYLQSDEQMDCQWILMKGEGCARTAGAVSSVKVKSHSWDMIFSGRLGK
jgi:hypothetical protein